MYKVLSSSIGRRKSFSIVCSLKEGYKDGAYVHSREETLDITRRWQENRINAGMPALSGTLILGDFVFAWPKTRGEAKGLSEQVVRFEGEISPLYNPHLVTEPEQAKGVINDLAAFLGQALGQERIYVSFDGETWAVERE